MTAKGEGSAVIFAKHNSRYYRCSVTVSGNMLTPAVEGTSWHFIMQLKNSSSKDITLTKLEIIDYLNGETVGEPWSRSGNELASLHLGNVVLSKGETHTWDDWHPVVTRYDHRDYVFTFKNASDKTSKQTFSYQLAAQQSNLGGSTCDIGLTPSKDGGNWVFNIILENNTARSITLQKLTVLKKLEGKTLDTYSYSKAQCADMSLSTAALKAGAFTFWEDFHPVVNDFDEFEYTFTFKDSAGKTVKQVFSFNLSTQIINYSENQEKDLKTLRHDADFEVKIADGIYWVPANALGESRYTNAEIYDMLTLSPGKKQSKFSTLYEALQLYQVGNFYSSDDNIRVYENGVNWEHRKPGYDAVRTNNGCCATSANWLNYILKNDYDEVGYIETSQADGSGHIYNYIKQDGWYYIIDMTHYRTDWVATSLETGDINDYYPNGTNGNILKTKSIQKYLNYIQNESGDPPAFMAMYTASNCVAVDGLNQNGKVTLIYEKDSDAKIKVIYDDPNDNVTQKYVTSPTDIPDWSRCTGYRF